jgi:hypothetical protein
LSTKAVIFPSTLKRKFDKVNHRIDELSLKLRIDYVVIMGCAIENINRAASIETPPNPTAPANATSHYQELKEKR